MYVLWDVIGECSYLRRMSQRLIVYLHIDDTIARKVNSSDASAFAKICGCFPSQGNPSLLFLTPFFFCDAEKFCRPKVWGVIWLFIAFCFFIIGILVGIVAFKVGLDVPSPYL